MNSIRPLFFILVILTFIGCNKKEDQSKTYTSKVLTSYETFNEQPLSKGDSITILKVTEEKESSFRVKFRDTTVRIQINPSDSSVVSEKFSFAKFVNTQKTALLVQIADKSGLVAPSFLIALKNGKLDVVSLYRESKGNQDQKFTKGITKVGATGYIVDNDFYVTNVKTNVYLIKRQNPTERIQGDFLMISPDKQTLTFLVANSIYQVNFPSDEVVTLALPSNAPKQESAIYEWLQKSYHFEKNNKGLYFLQSNKEDNRIRNISEFK